MSRNKKKIPNGDFFNIKRALGAVHRLAQNLLAHGEACKTR